ncbi:hypothetical protein IDJ77_00510 [Mucilaginibacter sp. ZT4R22]|uniref:Uncharacterized protein n=1 Tax=Mucilaginibacter pankratovii TaxID=2772110 RepID=A0ABR7WIW8_9SPHI|nr:hypothetical protein [Mucilaginibacter pankratovii]MBD1362275.1 hypothetical protein [Mucilaginibacter pankratovii]
MKNRSTGLKIIACLGAGLLACIVFWPRYFCGELDSSLKARIKEANKRFGVFFVAEPTPCEYSYINVKLQQKSYKLSLLDSLHSMLYNKTTREGWAVIMVYDENGEYVISHSPNSKLYKQTGD